MGMVKARSQMQAATTKALLPVREKFFSLLAKSKNAASHYGECMAEEWSLYLSADHTTPHQCMVAHMQAILPAFGQECQKLKVLLQGSSL